MGQRTTPRVIVGLVAILALAGCAGADEGEDPGDAGPTGTGRPAATDDEQTSLEETGSATASPAATDDEPASLEAAGSGTATVNVDDETFTFRVIQCLRDVPGFMGGTVAFQLDGVPPDTPEDLIEPLLGPVDPDADIQGALAPVFDVGPILSVSRVTDGGDLVALSTGLDAAYVTNASATAAEERFLDISDATSGATVQGVGEMTTPSGTTAEMSLDAVCP